MKGCFLFLIEGGVLSAPSAPSLQGSIQGSRDALLQPSTRSIHVAGWLLLILIPFCLMVVRTCVIVNLIY